MANHLHRQIRDAVATALTGLTTTAARVYPNRLHKFETTSLPGLRITLPGDSVSPTSVHQPHVQQHALTIDVECVAKAVSDLDDTCDLMAKEVEIALSAGISIGGRPLYPLLTGSEYDDEAAGTPAGAKRLTFSVEYHTLNTQPDALS
jgi:hypothetical protein